MGARTKPGGFCFALKLPDGDWGGLHTSQDSADGWAGGSIPGWFQTREQQILKQTPLKPGQQPSGTTGQLLEPLPVEQWENIVESSAGQRYTVFVGYVEADGNAAGVRDPGTRTQSKVLAGGYFVLVEPGDDADDQLQAVNANGQSLKPDYTWGEMLPGYSAGPSQS